MDTTRRPFVPIIPKIMGSNALVGILVFLVIAMLVMSSIALTTWALKRLLLNKSTRDGFNNKDHLVYNRWAARSAPKTEAFVKIRVGGNDFKVHEDLDNPEEAARVMSRLNDTANQLIDVLKNKYILGDGMTKIKPEFKDRVRKGINDLIKNYRTPNLEENIPERSGGDTSYVIDKGDTFAMCLRSPEQGNKLEKNYNDLAFVLFHEMTHLFNETYGHDFMFWSNFRFVLTEAVEAGLYQSVDYKKTKSPYCGIKITYSPLHDTELPSYYEN